MEERDWRRRQQVTGSVGRLVSYQIPGDCPQADFLLRGGLGKRVMVAQVTEGGKAQRSGVRAGDMLVSVDGRKDFEGQPGELLHASLTVPVVLVFMGFVGKPTAEVQLTVSRPTFGFPSARALIASTENSQFRLSDQVVFQSNNSMILAATKDDKGVSRASAEVDAKVDEKIQQATAPSAGVFELRQSEAMLVVKSALSPRPSERRSNLSKRSPFSASKPGGSRGSSQVHVPHAPTDLGLSRTTDERAPTLRSLSVGAVRYDARGSEDRPGTPEGMPPPSVARCVPVIPDSCRAAEALHSSAPKPSPFASRCGSIKGGSLRGPTKVRTSAWV